MFFTQKLFYAATILVTANTALAETYYVAPSGNASWSQCTNIATPCSGKTAAENATAGDLVYFRGGTYYPHNDPVADWSSRSNNLKYESLPWNPSHSGTETNPIVFMAYPNETPVIVDNIYSAAFGAARRDWIVFDGFTGTIADSSGAVITMAILLGTDHCTIKNSNLSGVIKNGHENSALIRVEDSRYPVIENNVVHGMNGGVNSTGILNFNSTNLVVKNNDIYDNYIGIWDKDTEQNNVYFQNHIWGPTSSSLATSCKVGIQINNQANEFGSATGAKAFQNIIRNCDTGVFVYDSPAVNNLVSIFNNVIYYGASNPDVGIMVSEYARDAEIYNNIVDGYGGQLRYASPVGTTVNYSDNNIFYPASSILFEIGFSSDYFSLNSWTGATSLDVSSDNINPMFVNAGGTDPADYKLQSGSPALGSGRGGFNIGAYPEATSAAIGFYSIRPKAPRLF